MSTMAEAKCTDEQKAEWQALYDRMRELQNVRQDVERDLAGWMVDYATGRDAKGDPLDADGLDFTLTRATEKALDVKRLRDEWDALYEQAQAHPYTAEVNARREQQ